MQLLYQTHSPYARKALVFAHEAGLAARIDVVHHETSPTLRNEQVYAQNPLGKVPVLLRAGLALSLTKRVHAAIPPSRLQQLRWQTGLVPRDAATQRGAPAAAREREDGKD